MIDVLGRVDPRENLAQTVTLSKLTGTVGARYCLGRDVLRWPYRRASVC